MTKEMVIASNRHETKVAILEDDQLVEIYFQRSNEYSLVGSIHKGRVTRVLPGMQSAFVELGLERDAFLYVSDFAEQADEDYERVTAKDSARPEGRPPAAAPAGGEAPAEASPGEPAARGDRRGRGRRRRRRGRGNEGIPESKYASSVNPTPALALAAPEPAAAGMEEEPLILPGESIAKYSQGEEPEVTTAEAEPGIEEQPEASAVAGDLSEPLPEEGEEEAADELEQEVQQLVAESLEEEAEAAHERALAATASGKQMTGGGTAGPAEEPPEESMEASGEEASGEEVVLGELAEADTMEAAVRDQPVARYIQRGHRRMRRRGRSGDRYDAVPRPAPELQTAVRPEREQKPRERERERERVPQPSISELLKEGQEIIVQIAKEPLGQKGARITSHIAMPGRYVVFMPTLDHLGVSRKLASDEERQRLKRIVQTHAQGIPGGFIVRTAGEGKSEAEIAADMNFLYSQWLDIRKKAEKRHAPCLLHSDLELVTRTLRDQVSEQFKAVWVDNEEVYESVVGFLERFQPNLVSRVKLYTREVPVFDTFNVTSELEKALRPKVWLKSGGYIVINQTEALVAIDINTGKFVGKSNRLEDTIVKTNLEAVKEIVRQIRLRDLGGIIVVDFIDMDERRNRQKVMQGLEEAMRADRAPYKILQFNDFGLVAITRRRVKQSLERALCAPCPTCEGAGYVKSPQTIVGEVLTEAHKIAASVEGKDVMLRVNPEVAKALKSGNYLPELEEILGRTVIVKSDPLLHPEKFDLA
jgi:ribonuclease G